jgi:hypothetical protein
LAADSDSTAAVHVRRVDELSDGAVTVETAAAGSDNRTVYLLGSRAMPANESLRGLAAVVGWAGGILTHAT